MGQSLSNLKNTHKISKKGRRVGRGIGSGVGKTSGRGQKGAGARSGYRRRLGYEGGQMRLYMKVPCRGFNHGRFEKRCDVVNFYQIEAVYEEGDLVNPETLKERGLVSGKYPIKLLGDGELSKQVKIELHALSKTAQEKLHRKKISFTPISK